MDKITRREFIRLSTLASAGLIAGACAKTPEPTPVPKAAATPTTTQPKEQPSATPVPVQEAAKEAPMLSDMVTAGSLPPADERLPENPAVCPVMEMVGKYGGSIRRGFNGVSDRWGPDKVTHKSLIWYDADLSLRATICESWTTNEDATEWTFTLRKGMKWSDAAPFDSENAKWWYENVLLNETLTASTPAGWSTGTPRVLMEMEFPDAYTIAIKFAHPNPLFVYTVTTSDPYAPGHYLAQFHADLTDDKAALEKATVDAGFETWDQYFGDRNSWYLNPSLPATHAWPATNPLSEELFVMERNPYFWQTDPDGNQLPYTDRVQHRLFNTQDVFNMWVINGEIDYQQRHVLVDNYTLFLESEEQGDYKVVLGADDATDTIALNHTCKEERVREMFQNRDVRLALSLAINRDEINDLIYNELALPRQYSPPEQSPQFYPKLSDAYIEYDPDRANELLDGAGYSEKDSEGYRMWKDGSGETITLIIDNYSGATLSDEGQLVLKYWADVGIKAVYNNVERGLAEERGRANDVMIEHHKCSRAVLPIVDPSFFIGRAQDKSWCKGWTLWYNNPDGPNAEEPPADHFIRQMWDLWGQIEVEADAAKQDALLYQIFDILAVEIPMPGTVGQFPALIIKKNGLRNLSPDYVMPISNPTYHGCLIPMQSYFWEDPENHA